MRHEPNIATPVADLSGDEFDAWMAALPPALGIRHIDDEDDAQAIADLEAGCVHSHATVSEWSLTWGKPDRRSCKEWLTHRNG